MDNDHCLLYVKTGRVPPGYFIKDADLMLSRARDGADALTMESSFSLESARKCHTHNQSG